MNTSSSRYFVEAGSTSPESRLITIRPKPSARIPRRGFKSAITSGSSFQDAFAVAGLVGAPDLSPRDAARVHPSVFFVCFLAALLTIPLMIRIGAAARDSNSFGLSTHRRLTCGMLGEFPLSVGSRVVGGCGPAQLHTEFVCSHHTLPGRARSDASDAGTGLVRPFELDGVAAEAACFPCADVADLTIVVVVPPLSGDWVRNGLAEFVGCS